MRAKLTALKYNMVSSIADNICPNNAVFVYREETDKDSSGVAYRVDCKSVTIGYLPDLKSLRKYLKDAKTDKEYTDIVEWGKAVKAIRNQFKIDYDQYGTEKWTGVVAQILYTKDGKWVHYQGYSDLAQKDKAEGWALGQVAVTFPVEVF